MQSYRKLKVWSKSHDLTIKIYKITESFPDSEKYGLSSQMRRSAYSIPTNIAEGVERNSNSVFLNFLNISLGSANELEYQILLAKDLNYIDCDKFNELNHEIGEIRAMLISLESKINS